MRTSVIEDILHKHIHDKLTSEPQTLTFDGEEAFVKMEHKGCAPCEVEVHFDDKVFVLRTQFRVDVHIQSVETRQEWEARQDKEAK
jgi:hypothetical protein